HGKRAADSSVHGRSPGRPDHLRHRAPALHDPAGRSHSAHGRRAGHRARHARRLDAGAGYIPRDGTAADGITRARRRPGAAMTSTRDAFLAAAMWHGSLAPAEAILAAHPELASSDIHTAAVLGDDGA